jgi:hypothetical protein
MRAVVPAEGANGQPAARMNSEAGVVAVAALLNRRADGRPTSHVKQEREVAGPE